MTRCSIFGTQGNEKTRDKGIRHDVCRNGTVSNCQQSCQNERYKAFYGRYTKPKRPPFPFEMIIHSGGKYKSQKPGVEQGKRETGINKCRIQCLMDRYTTFFAGRTPPARQITRCLATNILNANNHAKMKDTRAFHEGYTSPNTCPSLLG